MSENVQTSPKLGCAAKKALPSDWRAINQSRVPSRYRRWDKLSAPVLRKCAPACRKARAIGLERLPGTMPTPVLT